MSNRYKFCRSGRLSAALFLLLVTVWIATPVLAMPPHPDALEKLKSGEGRAPQALTDPDHRHASGICSAEDNFFGEFLKQRRALAASSGAQGSPGLGTFNILGILVEFSDHASSVPATFFDSLVYGTSGSTVHTYYDEVSRSQIDLVTVNSPSSLGWQTAPQTYAYYVGPDQGMGTYPNNTQKLTEDLVDMVDGTVDFANYDNDNDGYVDVLLVIHSGTGAEYSASANDIWSHKWGLPSSKLTNDGVRVSTYTVQPEFWSSPGDMTIGVYCHELGHGFGLPDLYDVDYTSQGVGRWCLMSGGSWNGSLGNSPSYFSAWCRAQIGIDSVINVTANRTGESIASVESGGPVYRLWSSGATGDEYFLVENRQRTGFDAALPGDGLLIWHIDEAAPTQYGSNVYEWYPGSGDDAQHFLVALEQADGLFELDKTSGQSPAASDGSDPFPGTWGVTTFGSATVPSSAAYTSGSTLVAVSNISSSAVTMTADFIVGLAAGVDPDDDAELPTTVALNQNYPNPFNPTTEIEFTVSQAADVNLTVFNVLGQEVKTLLEANVSAGTHTVTWDASDNTGETVASGIYFYRLTANGVESVKKMVLVR